MAGQSVISSSLNITINGGSYKDNLTNALLANIGSQINAEGAKLIGDNGEVLGVVGKSVSHAVVRVWRRKSAAVTVKVRRLGRWRRSWLQSHWVIFLQSRQRGTLKCSLLGVLLAR
ncbi:Possible hemagglutinin (DUF637) [Serratia proteamaculans]|nr:Possible hemagglutinin (DUF637) [Serratia proteamaculans]